jgi:hypothetical protein
MVTGHRYGVPGLACESSALHVLAHFKVNEFKLCSSLRLSKYSLMGTSRFKGLLKVLN